MAKTEKKKPATKTKRPLTAAALLKLAKVKPAKAKPVKAKATKTKTSKAKPTKSAKLKATKLKLGGKKSVLKPSPALLPPPPVALGHSSAVLDRLWSVVMSRRDADPTISHSARLLSRGTAKVAQKFGEEAVECLIEATSGTHEGLIAESADVLYHLLVLWVNANVRPDEVWAELQRREGVSGIAEKAARAKVLPLARRLGTRKIP
jgi:phosphoribosyl-ATP pyrophosphohydrolase